MSISIWSVIFRHKDFEKIRVQFRVEDARKWMMKSQTEMIFFSTDNVHGLQTNLFNFPQLWSITNKSKVLFHIYHHKKLVPEDTLLALFYGWLRLYAWSQAMPFTAYFESSIAFDQSRLIRATLPEEGNATEQEMIFMTRSWTLLTFGGNHHS